MDHENQFMKSSGEYREVCKYRESNILERRSARKLSVGACSRPRGLSATINTAFQSSVQPSEREGDGGGVRAGATWLRYNFGALSTWLIGMFRYGTPPPPGQVAPSPWFTLRKLQRHLWAGSLLDEATHPICFLRLYYHVGETRKIIRLSDSFNLCIGAHANL